MTGVVCLMNGTVESEGQVLIGGRPVCDDSWDDKDGNVVCRQVTAPVLPPDWDS